MALYQTMHASPASITAANVIIAFGMLKGHKITSADAINVPEFPSTFPSCGNLALVVYVDDFLLSGDSDGHDAFWAEWSKRIMIEDVGDLSRFLRRHHTTIAHDDHERLAFDMRAYAKDMI